MAVKLPVPLGGIWDSRYHFQALHELSHVRYYAQYLSGKLSTGREYQGLGVRIAQIDPRQHIEGECGGFSST